MVDLEQSMWNVCILLTGFRIFFAILESLVDHAHTGMSKFKRAEEKPINKTEDLL